MLILTKTPIEPNILYLYNLLIISIANVYNIDYQSLHNVRSISAPYPLPLPSPLFCGHPTLSNFNILTQ